MAELTSTQRSPAEPVAAPQRPPSPGRGRRHRFFGWNVVGAGLAVQTVQGGLMQQAYGTYAVALREEFGWSSTTLSAGYSLNRLESGLLGPVHGWALQRFGSRAVMQSGTVVMAVGLI